MSINHENGRGLRCTLICIDAINYVAKNCSALTRHKTKASNSHTLRFPHKCSIRIPASIVGVKYPDGANLATVINLCCGNALSEICEQIKYTSDEMRLHRLASTLIFREFASARDGRCLDDQSIITDPKSGLSLCVALVDDEYVLDIEWCFEPRETMIKKVFEIEYEEPEAEWLTAVNIERAINICCAGKNFEVREAK